MYIQRFTDTIKEGEKVIDLGSGHDPHPRADVCVDYYIEDSTQRNGVEFVKPANATLIKWDLNAYPYPFKDKEFDFVICAHILEHVDRPDLFCNEIQRIAKRGYIESPNKFYEKLFGWDFHKWYINIAGGNLVFEKIENKGPFAKVGRALYNFSALFTATHDRNIEFLLTSFYWEDQFEFKTNEPTTQNNIQDTYKYFDSKDLDLQPIVIKKKFPFFIGWSIRLVKRLLHISYD